MKTAACSARYRWQLVAWLWGISFFNYADRQAIFSVFPLLEKEMGLTPVQLGLLASSFAWVYGGFSLFAGMFVDRIPRVPAILGGLTAWSAICAATAASTGYPMLLFFRAAEGLGESVYFPASMSLVSSYHASATRSRAMGLHQTSVYIGTIGGGFFSGLIGQEYGWRWSFVVFGGLGLIYALILRRVLIEAPRSAHEERHAPKLASVPQLLSRPVLLLLLAAFFLANFVAVVLLSWMPKLLYDRFGLNLAMSGLAGTLFVQLASMAGATVGGAFADRWRRYSASGRIAVQAVGVFGGAPFVVFCGITTSTAMLLVALTAWGFFKGLYDANIFAAAFDVAPAETRGTVAGLMNTVGWVGGGGAGLAVGFLSMKYGLAVAISLTGFVYLLAGICLLTAARLIRS